MSKLLPNTFQHHNFYIDQLAYYLTSEEEKVLNRAVREILGWQDRLETRSARIALSVFVDGRFKKGMPKTEENRLSLGCGLSEETVRRCLKSLSEFNILVRSGNITQAGELYTLQIDSDLINWDALRTRRQEKEQKSKDRIQTARDTRLVTQHPSCHTTPVLCDKTPPVLCDKTPPVLCDKTQKRQSKTKSNPNNNGAAAPLVSDFKTAIKEKFIQLTMLPEPNMKTQTNYWWSQFGEIASIFNGFDLPDALEGIDRVIKYMNKEELVISGPQSIVNLCRRYVAQQRESKIKNDRVPAGLNLEAYEQLQRENGY